ERAQAVELLEQLLEGLARLGVREGPVAEALDAVGEALGRRVAALEELVHALRLVAALLALRGLLAIEDLLEAAAPILGRLVEPVALLERAPLGAQLLHQLVDA